MPLLKNQKHERFAQLLATGLSAAECYSKVYRKKGKVAGSAGPRLLRNVGIQQRLAELQQKSAVSSVMTLTEKREYLARVKRTPIGSIGPDSDLCQSHEVSMQGVKIRMCDKLKAVELDAKLAGEFTEKVEVKADGLLELLQAIRGGKRE